MLRAADRRAVEALVDGIVDELRKPREFHIPRTFVHRGETFCHITYSALVCIEAWGKWYAFGAGGVVVFGLLALFIREEGHV